MKQRDPGTWPAPAGSWVALPTPFARDRVDFDALRGLV
ncbi:MAG: dihydrodipicolinate synthase/N-acetylneuraminate lyase, partial [Planctomycetota bacterium]